MRMVDESFAIMVIWMEMMLLLMMIIMINDYADGDHDDDDDDERSTLGLSPPAPMRRLRALFRERSTRASRLRRSM